MDPKERKRLVEQHLDEIRKLEAQSVAGEAEGAWPPSGFYLVWHVMVGMALGLVGACVSLLANVVGGPLFGQQPLDLIRVYLTFPMGERALTMEDGAILTIGCILYLATGALVGIALHLVFRSYFRGATASRRFVVATVMGVGLWVVSFYLILSWLQPMLLGGNWIVSMIPWWVGALTHLAFTWTLSVGESWARFEPYRRAAVAAALMALLVPLAGCAEAPLAADQEDPLEYPIWETVAPGENQAYNQRASLVQRGQIVYDRHCVGCHGEYGDGNGAAAARLITKPRDFTSGIYKFRSTDSSSLPLEADLYRTITRGLARVSMPAFPYMAESDKLAVIEYIKTFYPRWESRKDRRQVVDVPQAPQDLTSPERVARGRAIYLATQCHKCHGVDGRGTGATQTDYTDAWGFQQKAFDFTRGGLKGGDQPEDVYRTFHTGLRSIMPSFGGDTLARVTAQAFTGLDEIVDAEEWERFQALIAELPADGLAVNEMSLSHRLDLAEQNSWDLVAYIMSLRTETTTADAVLGTVASTD